MIPQNETKGCVYDAVHNPTPTVFSVSTTTFKARCHVFVELAGYQVTAIADIDNAD